MPRFWDDDEPGMLERTELPWWPFVVLALVLTTWAVADVYYGPWWPVLALWRAVSGS